MPFYPNVTFLTSAAEAHQLAPDTGREIAFAGRSNAGKSSAINAITERTALARVSRTPGRTQLINFFELGNERRLVDLPGYGFAKVPEQVRARWLELMEHYFNVRESLVGLVLIVDSRRGLGAQDTAMLEWMLARGRHAHVLLTKSDKLNRRDAQRVLNETQAACSDTAVTAQLFSAHARTGLDDAREVMERWLGEDGSAADGGRQCSAARQGASRKGVETGLEKKGPGGAFAATEADQPGMGMTNRVCPLREKSGERVNAHRIRWGCPMKVPAPAAAKCFT